MCLFKKFQCSHRGENKSVEGDGSAQEVGLCRCRGGKAMVMMIFGVVLIVLLAAGSINLIVSASLKLKEAKNIASARTMAVSAEGKVTVSPDTANINFSVITEAKTTKEAQAQNTEKMNKVIEYVKVSALILKTSKPSLIIYTLNMNIRTVKAFWSDTP